MQHFRDLTVKNGLVDIWSLGAFHTWWNKQEERPITHKLDRVMGNSNWFTNVQNSDVFFSPWGLSDHSAALLNIRTNNPRPNKPFQFFNFWLDHPCFMPVVSLAWHLRLTEIQYTSYLRSYVLWKEVLKISTKNLAQLLLLIRLNLCSVQSAILNHTSNSDDFQLEQNLSGKLETLLA